MATAEPAPPYDDGSSTESEYYFDPAEEAQELAADAWAHELDAPGAPNQPETDKVRDNVTIKQEFSHYRSASEDSKDIALPQGSEWSHGAAVYDDAVERALAMASKFESEMRKTQREEALTDDTMNSGEQEHEQQHEQHQQPPPPSEMKQKDRMVLRTLSSSAEVKAKVKPTMISLKSVKAPTPPAFVKNSAIVGLRRPPTKVVGAPSELERGLSVARSTWKASGSQSSSQKASPTNRKTSQAKDGEETAKVAAEKQVGQGELPSIAVRSKELEKVSSSRRTEHSESQRPSRLTDRSKSQSRRRSRSPSKHPTNRTDHSKSQARHRSPSRSRRREENERRSRSPYRSTVTTSPRSRPHRFDDRTPRYEYESERRPSRRDERSRSPPRYLRYQSRGRSRGRGQDRQRYDRHEGSRQIRHDNGGTGYERSGSTNRDVDLRRLSTRESGTSHGKQKNGVGFAREDGQNPQTARVPHEKEVQSSSKRGNSRCDAKTGDATIRRHDERDASKRQCDESEPAQPRPASHVSGQPTKKSPKDPRVRAQVGVNAARHNTNKKPATFRHFPDEFERKVHKLKLRDADLNEKEAAAQTRRDSRNFGNRRRGIEAAKAQLEAQDLERFEKLYESMTVSKEELELYQTRREFAYRVVCYKRRQAALQERTGVFGTPEETAVQWRRLDDEREQLIRENSDLFHDVMMGQHELGRTYEARSNATRPRKPEKRTRNSDIPGGEPFLKRVKRGLTAAHKQLEVSSSSRVVVGASLQHGSGGDPPPSQPSNTPWFLKG